MPIDRLARRERDVPIPNPDTPTSLVATLADWGAEHRPQQPCTECGCTLWWTAAGADTVVLHPASADQDPIAHIRFAAQVRQLL